MFSPIIHTTNSFMGKMIKKDDLSFIQKEVSFTYPIFDYVSGGPI